MESEICLLYLTSAIAAATQRKCFAQNRSELTGQLSPKWRFRVEIRLSAFNGSAHNAKIGQNGVNFCIVQDSG
jgi:hypothetical protein